MQVQRSKYDKVTSVISKICNCQSISRVEYSKYLKNTFSTSKPLSPILRVALEGNIAAGKSTFLEILRSEIDVICVPEPVSRWQNVNSEGGNPTGGNILGMFYNDPARWAYTFQSYAFLSRLKSQLEYSKMIPAHKAGNQQVILFERSVLSDKHVFAANCRASGLFSEVEWAMYCDWHAWLTSSFDTHLDAIIYLVESRNPAPPPRSKHRRPSPLPTPTPGPPLAASLTSCARPRRRQRA